jgi:hypothetical protein
MDCLKKYRVYCETEGQYVEVLRFSRPTRCPTNHRHVIDATKTVELERIPIDTETMGVYITAKSYQNTNGYYMMEGHQFDVSGGLVAATTNNDLVLPIGQCVYGLRLCAHEEHIHDVFSIIINPNTVVGVLTQAADAGSAALQVSDTVTANCIPGFYVSIDGVDEYQIIAKDDTSITLDRPLVSAAVQWSCLLLNVYIARNYMIHETGIVKIGYGTMGGKVMPAGTVLRLVYESRNGLEKHQVGINYEYTY